MNLYDLHNNPEELSQYNEIIKVPEFAYNYVEKTNSRSNVERFKQALNTVANDTKYAYKFAVYINDDIWPPGEDAIARDAETAFYYCYTLMPAGAWPKGEVAIATSAEYSLRYALDMLEGPFPAGEQAILNSESAEYAFDYAHWGINRRWPEAEDFIMKDPKFAFRYAKRVLKQRWPEAEQYIKQDNQSWRRYNMAFKDTNVS